MSNWTIGDWITYVPFILAVAGLAVRELVKDMPSLTERMPSFFTNSRWNYVPAILMIIGAATYGARQLAPVAHLLDGLPKTVIQGQQPVQTGFTQQQVEQKIASATASIQNQLDKIAQERDVANRRVKQLEAALRNAPPPPPPPAPADGPKVFTQKTVQSLYAPCADRTQLQCDLLIADEKGKWIKAEGRILIIQPSGQMTLTVGESPKELPVYCVFDAEWKSKLSVFRNNESIAIQGKINGYNGATLILTECELVP